MQVWEHWQTVYNNFDPEEVGGVRAEWRVRRPKSPVDDLTRHLTSTLGREKVLLLGSIGSGKSSELRRMAETQPPGRFVVVLDIYEHFANILNDLGRLETVRPWEVLFLVGLALWRAGNESSFFTDIDRNTLEDAAQQMHPSSSPIKVDVVKLATALGVGVLSTAQGATLGSAVAAASGTLAFLKAVAEGVNWNLPLGKREEEGVPDRESRTNRLLQAVNQLIQKVRNAGWETVLVVDGLDRIKDRQAAEHLFVDSGLLGRLECRVVMGGPLVLSREGLGARVRGFRMGTLSEVPVLYRDRFESDPMGIAFFRDLYGARTVGVPVTLGEEAMRKLTLYSGGRVREFIGLVRNIAFEAYTRRLDAVDDTAVDKVIDDQRRTLEQGLRANHLRVLQAIIDDPSHTLPAGDGEVDIVDQLLSRYWLLPYPNESEWFHPHPLLTLKKLKIPGSTG